MARIKGFTLVEMLVVIGIIGVLIAVMVPQVDKIRIRAKETATVEQAQSIELAIQNFAANHDGLYPGSAVDIMAPFPEHGLGDNSYVAGGNNNSAPPKFVGIVPALSACSGRVIATRFPSNKSIFRFLSTSNPPAEKL